MPRLGVRKQLVFPVLLSTSAHTPASSSMSGSAPLQCQFHTCFFGPYFDIASATTYASAPTSVLASAPASVLQCLSARAEACITREDTANVGAKDRTNDVHDTATICSAFTFPGKNVFIGLKTTRVYPVTTCSRTWKSSADN